MDKWLTMSYEKAMKSIRQTYLACIFIALTMTWIIIGSSAKLLPIDYGVMYFADVFAILLLAVFIFFKSRAAAVIAFFYYLSSKIIIVIEQPKSIGAWLGFTLLYFFVVGVRGTFAYHRIIGNHPTAEKFSETARKRQIGFFKIPLISFIAMLFLTTGSGLLIILIAGITQGHKYSEERAMITMGISFILSILGMFLLFRSNIARLLCVSLFWSLLAFSFVVICMLPKFHNPRASFAGFAFSLLMIVFSLFMLRILHSEESKRHTHLVYELDQPINAD